MVFELIYGHSVNFSGTGLLSLYKSMLVYIECNPICLSTYIKAARVETKFGCYVTVDDGGNYVKFHALVVRIKS